jgi:hypothetical protein
MIVSIFAACIVAGYVIALPVIRIARNLQG